MLKIDDAGQEWKQNQVRGHRTTSMRNDGGLDWTVSYRKITRDWICYRKSLLDLLIGKMGVVRKKLHVYVCQVLHDTLSIQITKFCNNHM